MSSCPSLQCLSVRAGIEIQLSPSVTKVKRAASKSLSTSVSHHPTTFQQTELANNLCKLKHTNINIKREVPAARCCTGKNLSLDLALPSFGIPQRGHPSVETRQDVGLFAWAVDPEGPPSSGPSAVRGCPCLVKFI